MSTFPLRAFARNGVVAACSLASLLALNVGGCPGADDPTLVAGITAENPGGGSIAGGDGGANQVNSDPNDPASGGSGPNFLGAGGGYASGGSNGAGGGDPQPTAPLVGISGDIQAALDTVGYYYIPPGLHSLEAPIILRANTRLEGAGLRSTLRYIGPGNFAIQMGELNVPIYGAYLSDFAVQGGGLHVVNMAQTCAVERVWFSEAPADGVLIDGMGERLIFRDVVAWGNAGNGFAVRQIGAVNGIVWDHCNAQNNGKYGVLLEGVGSLAEIRNLVFRDCTVQSNAMLAGHDSEIMIRGLVRMIRFENLWIENPRGLRCGIRTESVTIGTNVIHPGRVVIAGTSVINLVPNALEFDTCYDCRVEQLDMSVGTLIRWRQFSPGGAMWLVPNGSVQPL